MSFEEPNSPGSCQIINNNGLCPPSGTGQYGSVQYGTGQYSTVRVSTGQYSTVRVSTVRYGSVWVSTVRYGSGPNTLIRLVFPQPTVPSLDSVVYAGK